MAFIYYVAYRNESSKTEQMDVRKSHIFYEVLKIKIDAHKEHRA